MEKEKFSLEELVKKGVEVLAEFLPLKNYLYFPLIYSALIWAARRPKERKSKIFSWEVWPEPGIVETKPDRFILDFFENHRSLNRIYEKEIKERNLPALRKAFSCLYPLLGLEAPFLCGLFNQELEEEDYPRIVADFENRISQAKEDIEAVKDKPRLAKNLEALGREFLSLNLHLLSENKIRKIILDQVEAWLKGKKE